MKGKAAVRLPLDEELDKVVNAQQYFLTLAEKEALNAQLTLRELGAVVEALANHKCPGVDETSNEFYKANWMVVGLLVLALNNQGYFSTRWSIEGLGSSFIKWTLQVNKRT